MKHRATLFILLALVIWLAASLVRVENQRYALRIGMCEGPVTSQKFYDCIETVQTRTGWWWHLFYALKG